MSKILKKMYESVDKMNQYLLQGNIELAIKEYIAQQLLRKQFEEK
jgi:hypothetical protein